ncbi:insulinase family protein [Bacillus wiedmannii]|uniref:M16 family metallopeptidase n=1 Tax=Bacillus wiedmannii TaxID=1890302 RepID=UPI001CBD3521|nr:insulinase family protein [Bacillus wiedmannii]MBZ4225793.1 insulinase family protein [Bacillus wiedmannii]
MKIKESINENIKRFKVSDSNIYIWQKPLFNTQYVSIGFQCGGMTKHILKNKELVSPGIAHLVEHITLDGIKNGLFKEFMLRGARCNGYTHLINTVYTFETMNDNTGLLIEYINHLLNLKVEDEIVIKQKEIILSEIRTQYKSPYELLINRSIESLLEEDHKWFSIIGTEEDLINIQLDEIINFKNQFYNLSNMNVLVSGAVNEQKLLNSFNEIKSLKHSESNLSVMIGNKEVKARKVSNNENQLVLSFKDAAFHNEYDIVYSEILMTILFEYIIGNGSKLFNQLKVKKCNMSFFSDFTKRYGVGIINVISNDNSIDSIETHIYKYLENFLKNNEIDDKEFIYAKNRVYGRTLSLLDYPNRASDKIQWLLSYGVNYKAYLTFINSVTKSQIINYGEKILNKLFR